MNCYNVSIVFDSKGMTHLPTAALIESRVDRWLPLVHPSHGGSLSHPGAAEYKPAISVSRQGSLRSTLHHHFFVALYF